MKGLQEYYLVKGARKTQGKWLWTIILYLSHREKGREEEQEARLSLWVPATSFKHISLTPQQFQEVGIIQTTL